MTAILRTLIPVLLMIGLGAFLRRRRIFSDTTIAQLKTLLTQVILLIAIFHALATAEYNAQAWLRVGIMLAMMALSFAVGYALRPLVKPPFRKYIPFMVSVYEGGMIAYPLYAQLCGSENLSHIALLDIAGLLFGFSVYMGMLSFTESGEKPSVQKLVLDAFKSPPFVSALIGVFMGVSGLMQPILQSGLGSVYLAAEQTITAPLSAMILLVVGYSIRLEKRLIRPCLQTIALRFGLQAALLGLTLLLMRRLMPHTQLTDLAVILYMSAPATFSMQSFVRDEQGGSYVSTTNALYCFVSIAVYAVASVIV